MTISMLKIRRPLGRYIFNMGIAIPGKTVFLIETAPWIAGHLGNIIVSWNTVRSWGYTIPAIDDIVFNSSVSFKAAVST